jgi:CBS domain containing-hemolysin-like protein
VADEFGVIQGLVTNHDLLEAIVGELPDEDETRCGARGRAWLIHGTTNIHQVEQALNCDGLVSESDEYVTLAGMLLPTSAPCQTSVSSCTSASSASRSWP